MIDSAMTETTTSIIELMNVEGSPLSVERLDAINFAPMSLDDCFLASENASRLPRDVKVSRGIR